MKFAFSSNAFLRCDLQEAIRTVASIGYEGIEIMADVPHAYPLHLTKEEILKIRRTLEENHLEISNINAFMHHADGDTYHPSWIERDPALRAKRVEYTLRCIDLAAALGARNLSTEPGGPLEGMSRDEALRFYRQGLAAVRKRAKGKGIRILIEPEPGLLIENSQQVMDLLRELDPEIFGINFDVGHFFCVGEDPCQLIRSMQPWIYHFHLEDIAATRKHYHLMLGTGAIDLVGVLDTIDQIGYQDFVTVELYTYEHAAAKAAEEAFRYLQKIRNNRQR